MRLGKCGVVTNQQGRELKEHGTSLFPLACYYDDLAKAAIPWHWHDELEMVVVETGTAAAGVNGQIYTVEQGNGFFIRSGALHGVWNQGKSQCRLHSVVFHPRLVGGSVDSIFWQGYVEPLLSDSFPEFICFHRAVDWEAAATAAIEETWETAADGERGYEFSVRGALSRVIFLLSCHLPTRNEPPSERTLRNGDRIKTMLQYVQDHYGEELTTAGIARSASVSESECLRCFRKMIGTTPIQCVRQFRVQKAAELLTATDQTIAEIGAACGFQEMSYFAKVFREIKGCTPSEYRRTERNI